jgi:hypothetical protein
MRICKPQITDQRFKPKSRNPQSAIGNPHSAFRPLSSPQRPFTHQSGRSFIYALPQIIAAEMSG